LSVQVFTEHLDRLRKARYDRLPFSSEVFVMRAAYVSSALEDIPVDFFADPDGCWEYDQLAQVAGFDQAWGQLSIGALTEPYSGFPDGAAVVMFTSAELCTIALVDCIAVEDELSQRRGTGRGHDGGTGMQRQTADSGGPLVGAQRTDVAA